MNRKFNLKMFFYTVIASVFAFGITEALVYVFNREMSYVIMVGVYFSIAALFLYTAVLICEIKTERVNGRYWSSKFGKKMFKFVPIISLVVMLNAAGLEYLYEINFSGRDSIDDYVILIDNSGSMSYNDFGDIRYDAVISFVEKMTSSNRIAIYLFDHSLQNIVPFQDMTDNAKQDAINLIMTLETNMDGGTNIRNAIDGVMEEMEEFATDSKRNMKLIMLSDGADDSYYYADLNDALRKYTDNNVKIDTVQLINEQGWETMSKLAEITGGQSVFIDDASWLIDVYDELIYTDEDRNLIEARKGLKEDSTTYAILRIVFIALISLLISGGVAIILDNSAFILPFAVKGIVTGILAGLILELGFSKTEISPLILRFISLELIMVILSFFSIRTYDSNDEMYGDRNRSMFNYESDAGKKKTFR